MCLCVSLCACLRVRMPVCLSLCLCVCTSVCHLSHVVSHVVQTHSAHHGCPHHPEPYVHKHTSIQTLKHTALTTEAKKVLEAIPTNTQQPGTPVDFAKLAKAKGDTTSASKEAAVNGTDAQTDKQTGLFMFGSTDRMWIQDRITKALSHGLNMHLSHLHACIQTCIHT
jgi:hypothetical protein